MAVERRAKRRCEYCLCPLAFATEAFVVEHIIPAARSGHTVPDNLALACSGCNGHKYDKVNGFDRQSETTVRLFHPRLDDWREHFAWNDDFTHVIGLTPIGRATIMTLELNREGVVNLRYVLYLVGLHPPADSEFD